MTIGRTAVLVLALAVWPAAAQKNSKPVAEPATEKQFVNVDQPNADQTKRDFDDLLSHYPPTLRTVFKEDPTLLTQQQYLAPYPALVSFLNTHPEVTPTQLTISTVLPPVTEQSGATGSWACGMTLKSSYSS